MSTFYDNYEWEEITFERTRSGGPTVHKNEVWFLKASKSSRPSKMYLSRNLTDELCWTSGDRVQLYRLGNELWALKLHKVGLITLKSDEDSKVAPLYYTSASMCLNFDFDKYGTVFDAWVDGEALFFKPKKKG